MYLNEHNARDAQAAHDARDARRDTRDACRDARRDTRRDTHAARAARLTDRFTNGFTNGFTDRFTVLNCPNSSSKDTIGAVDPKIESNREPDIRWIQRRRSFSAALRRLRAAAALSVERPLSDLERQGLIQSFEFTHEFAWNLLKDILQWQGVNGLLGSRDAVREAFSVGLINNGEIWMEMITSRNQTTRTYNEEAAGVIAEKVCEFYLAAFNALERDTRELLDAQ